VFLGKSAAIEENALMELMDEYQRAMLFVEAGDPIEASRILKPIVEAEPGNAEVRLQLALSYFASAQLRGAETQLRALIDRDPSDHYAQHLLGRTLERQNRPDEALPHLRLASAMSPIPEYDEAVRRVTARVHASRR
jgi:thioredoxin-like negative regulator of GroEL